MTDTTPDRPLVTFALFAYNQEAYIREAVNGAFSQTYEPLEIILSDDCSSDRTFEIMQEMAAEYEGPHKVKVRRNEVNLGIASHVNTVISVSHGEFLVGAAGDDLSLPERTSVTVGVLKDNPEAGFAETAYISIKKNGSLEKCKPPIFDNLSQIDIRLLLRSRVKGLTGAARTYRLSILREFPPLFASCPTEDSTFVFRCLLRGTGFYVPRYTVKRRSHSGNASGPISMMEMNLDAIWAQYAKDLQFASQRGYISSGHAQQCAVWIEKQSYSRSLSQRNQRGKIGYFHEIRKIVSESTTLRSAIWKFSCLSKIFVRNFKK